MKKIFVLVLATVFVLSLAGQALAGASLPRAACEGLNSAIDAVQDDHGAPTDRSSDPSLVAWPGPDPCE